MGRSRLNRSGLTIYGKERGDTISPDWTFTAFSLVPVQNHNESVVVQKTRKLVRWLPNTERWEKWARRGLRGWGGGGVVGWGVGENSKLYFQG